MAAWNDITEGAQLVKCPVCLCDVSKRKIARHVQNCFDRNQVKMETLGVIKCPFDQNHIVPLTYLNHHLEGNCQEVLNLLRKFYQKEKEKILEYPGAPPDYDPGIPSEYLSEHNKDLLYMLLKDP